MQGHALGHNFCLLFDVGLGLGLGHRNGLGFGRGLGSSEYKCWLQHFACQ